MASESTANTQTSTFNNSEFVYEILILDRGGNVTQTFTKDEIIKLHLERDITKYYCTGTVIVKDIGNFYGILANGTGEWAIVINIVQIESLELVKNPTFNQYFIITSANIESIDSTCSRIKIHFADPIEQIFNRNVSYSSQNDADISEVLTGLLKATGFKPMSSDSRNYLPVIEKIGQTLNYITDTNTCALNHIDNVLSQIYSETAGFMFLYFNNTLTPIWTKPMLDSKIDLSNESNNIENLAYVLNIQSTDVPDRNSNVVVEMFPYNAMVPFKNSTRLVYPTYIQDFNYTTSRVEISSKNQWAHDKFSKLFAGSSNSTTLIPGFLEDPSTLIAENAAFFETAPGYAIGNFYRKSNVDQFYRDLRSYFLYCNLISFKVLGQIWRQPGRMYSIAYNQNANSGKLSGQWFCTKIVDEFESGKYYQYIFLTRTFDFVNLADISANTQQLIAQLQNKGYGAKEA